MGIRVSLGHKVFTYHKVTIGKNVWICTNATICPGVTPLDLWELELMDKLDIDWQPYRKGASKKPELPIERLKEKLAKEKG